MEFPRLVDEIAARVMKRLDAEDVPVSSNVRESTAAYPITGKAVTYLKVRDAFEAGHCAIVIHNDSVVTPEARDYIAEKGLTVTYE